MDIKSLIKENLRKSVKDVFSLDLEEMHLEHPTNDSWGDYSTNSSFKLAKLVHQSPAEVAKTLCYRMQKYDLTINLGGIDYPIFDSIDFTDTGFINFKISSFWLKGILTGISKAHGSYGSSTLGAGKTVIVEFSAANSNKPLHIGHARNNFIGSSLSNILSYLGYKVIKSNYIGDIGVHICKSLLMYQKYGNGETPNKKSDHFVGDFYAMFEREVEKDPTLIDEAKELLRKWEAGDKETLVLWKKMNSWVYDGWEQTFKDQNVSFDILEYESECSDLGKDIVNLAVEKGIAEKDETGAIIARLEKFGLPDKVLLRSDGTSIYSTKDLQLALNGYNKYHFSKRLYVVDVRQADYFKQVFKILDILGFPWAKDVYHISYGFVTLPEGKMSSRTGVVVNADDVFTRLMELEMLEVKKSTKDLEDKELVLKRVALGAFRYGLLKVDARQNMVFDYDIVTKFDGNTGPYLMYTYARASSLLERAKFVAEEISEKELLSEQVLNLSSEISLLRSLYKFPEIVLESGEKYNTNILCNYLYELCQKFNSFYSEAPILQAESVHEKNARLALTSSTSQVIKNGLQLLGIDVVDKM